MNKESKCFYPRIRSIRLRLGYSQDFIASRLGIKQTAYSRYERGASEFPIKHLIVLSRLYGVSIDFMVGND